MILNQTSKFIKSLLLFQFLSISLSLTISGKIIDKDGNKIPNVNIYTEKNGTISKKNGKFKIDIESKTVSLNVSESVEMSTIESLLDEQGYSIVSK